MKLDGESIKEVGSLVSGQRMACLSTIYRTGADTDSAGQVADFPFGSLVPYVLDPDGAPVIFISKIAEHYKNLKAEPRASLFVTDAFSAQDPAGRPRITLLAVFHEIDRLNAAAAAFHSTVPEEIAGNFSFFRGEIKRVRWIGGFGKINWIEQEEWRELWIRR